MRVRKRTNIVLDGTHQGNSGHRHPMPCRLEGSVLNRQWMTNQMNSFTFYDNSHILDETIDNLKRLSCSRPSFVLGKSVQPLENRLGLILSEELLYKFLCIASFA